MTQNTFCINCMSRLIFLFQCLNCLVILLTLTLQEFIDLPLSIFPDSGKFCLCLLIQFFIKLISLLLNAPPRWPRGWTNPPLPR